MTIESQAKNARQPPTLKDAQDHWNRGWSIFPLSPYRPNDIEEQSAKKPVGPWKQYQDERATPEQVKAWWRPGTRYNIALIAGTSGLVVLDVDMKDGKNGEESLRNLEAKNGKLPKTVEVITPSGGRHIFLKHPGPDFYIESKANAFGDEFPGLDVKGDGGYVVAVPSIHPNGKAYRWVAFQSPDDIPIAPLPDWLLKLLTQGGVKSKTNLGGLQGEMSFRVPDKIRDGERNDKLYRSARSMKAKNWSEAAILAALRAENQEKCDPPLEDPELVKLAHNAATQPDRPEFKAASGSLPVIDDEEETSPPDEALGDFPKSAWRGPFEVYRTAMGGTSEAPNTTHFSALWAVAAACLRRRVSFYYAFPHYPNVYIVNYGNTGDSKTSAARQGLRLLPEQGVKLLRGVGSAEALADWMTQPEGGSADSHLIFIEELATLLTRGSWEGSTLLSFLTETFDAPPKYEVPFRKNPISVVEPTPTLIAGTTIEWLWKGLREIDVHGGFGNRIFYLTGAPKEPIPLPPKPDPSVLSTIKAELHRLLTLTSFELFFDSEAQSLWKDFYIDWKKRVWPELTAAAVKRIPTYVIKLCMVYACFERTSLITRGQLESAISVGEYSARCTHQLMNRHRQTSLQGRCELRVMKALNDHDLPAWRIHQRISGDFTAEELARALRALEAAGVVKKVGLTRRSDVPIFGRRDRVRGT